MLIFVYGTLKKGFHNHRYLNNSTLLGKAKTKQVYTMTTNGSFPIVQRGGNTVISGEVYKVAPEDIRGIFALEGYTGVKGSPSNWYDTDIIDTKFGEASIFVMPPYIISGHEAIVEDGVFKY